MDLHSYIKDGVLSVKATPKASSNRILVDEGGVRVYVTCVPENGKANKAIIKLLAKELGIAKSSLSLIRGDTDRMKVFKIEE